jgi:uncharacterized protein (DUF1778 family)
MPNDETENDPNITTLGIRIPEELRAKIREAAKLEDRTESSFARYYLSRAADAVITAELEPGAAEQ